MTIIAPYQDLDAEASEALLFKRLTQQEAKALRELQPSLAPWSVIRLQVGVGFGLAVLAWVFTMQTSVAWSVAYGALTVVIPAMLFARGLMSQFSSLNVVSAGVGFFVWEILKIGVSVAMLFAAPKLVTELNWLALLIGLIVTMKVYWVALLMRPKQKLMNKS